MHNKVRAFMKEYHMVEEGDCVLAAVSGGADSLCLVLVMSAMCQELGIRLCVVHVEHGIRGEESIQDAQFVEQFCSQHQIPCKVFCCEALKYAREQKLTVEEGARELRYQFFRQAAEEFGADKIAVAHNQNDCAETMLFHLVRGSGLRGLSGIPPVRGQIIRPLLCVCRQEIEAYLARQNQVFCQDRTNNELIYTRNKIRSQVLPVLSEINSHAVSHINQTASFAAEAMELIDEMAEQACKKYVLVRPQGKCILQELLREKPLIQRSVLHKVLTETAGSSRDILKLHVQQVRELFERQSGKVLQLPYEMEAQRVYEGIFLSREKSKNIEMRRQKSFNLREQGGGWEVPQTGKLILFSKGYEINTQLLHKIPQNEEIPKKLYTKWFDCDKIKGTMRLRTRQEQDFLVIDAQGRRKKLKKYFIDEKIPQEKRDQILLLAEDNHILWVIGYRISEDVKVTEHTERILEIRVNGGSDHE